MNQRHLALVALLALAAPALAQDDIPVDLTYEYYLVTGSSLDEVEAAMFANGPNGFWAYTTHQVTWDGDCNLTVTATIILPELDENADLYDEEFAEFDRMIEALDAHELGHVDFGIGFAEEVQSLGCAMDTSAVQEPWLAAEIQYDADTQHGYLDGVYLDE